MGGGEDRQPFLGTDSITACHALENADRFHGDPVPHRHRSPLVELEQTCHVDRVHKPDHIFVLQYTKFLCYAFIAYEVMIVSESESFDSSRN